MGLDLIFFDARRTGIFTIGERNPNSPGVTVFIIAYPKKTVTFVKHPK